MSEIVREFAVAALSLAVLGNIVMLLVRQGRLARRINALEATFRNDPSRRFESVGQTVWLYGQKIEAWARVRDFLVERTGTYDLDEALGILRAREKTARAERAEYIDFITKQAERPKTPARDDSPTDL